MCYNSYFIKCSLLGNSSNMLVGNKIKDITESKKQKKDIIGIIKKIDNNILFCDRSDGQEWITSLKFENITWLRCNKKDV